MKKMLSFAVAALLALVGIAGDADVVALRNIAVATEIGTAPTLPEKVAGLKADGTVSGEYDVSWDTIPAPDEEGVTTVSGVATVEVQQMSVTASIRAAPVPLVNLTGTASEGFVKAFKTNTNPEKWLMSVEPLNSDQWKDYIANVQYSQDPNTTELTLGWSSPVTVSEVAIYFNGSGGNYQPPANVKFYDESGDSPTEIAFTAGAVVDSGTVYAHIVYTLESQKSLSKISFSATPATDSPSRLLFTRRMWVYGPDASGSVTPLSTDTLTALEVDGESVPDFDPDTFSYTVWDGEAITKAENETDNVAVTILPKNDNDNAYVVTLAENGSTKTYTVAMPIETCPHTETHLENVVPATCTAPGYTGDTVCDDCRRTIQKGSATEALGHDWGEWETTKKPTRDEPGSKRRECQRDGCVAEETQDIPKLPTLTLDPKEGTVSPTIIDLPADSLPTPTREGYHFVGWFKDEIDATAPYVRGKYLCGEPLTAPGVEEADKTLYAKWVKDDVYNHFMGKKVVFLGDSVTTLHGYAAVNRQLYTSNIYYNESKATQNGITAKNTWWGQLVQALDMDLLSVNAVSGSPVVDSEASIAYDVRAMSGTVRIDDLDVNGAPEVIFIFGGINDFYGNTKAALDDFDPEAAYLTGDLDLTSDYFPSFAEGYATMIRRLRHYYSGVEIVAIAPYYPNVNKETDAETIAKFDKGAKTIADLCDYFDVPHFDLRETQLPYWQNGVQLMLDQAHPNQAGFTEFANYVLENYEPACAHEHKTEPTGVIPATCTTDGYSGDCTCVDCGKEFPGHVITKLGHDWSDWVTTKEPTRDEPGEKWRECLRDGCDAEETVEIPKIVDVVALRNVAVATAVGAAPELPGKVAGIKADGTLGGEYDVAWDPVEAPTEEGVTTVSGSATVDDKVMTVTAFVRAAEVSVEYINVSPNATVVSNDPNGKQADVNRAISNSEPSANDVDWATANRGTADLVNTLTWSSAVTISKVRVCYSGNHKAPKSIAFSSDSSGSPEIEFTAGQVEEVGVHRWIEFTFNQPTELTTLRCFFGKPDSGWIVVERVWAYEMKIGTIEPQKTDALTALEVDGTTVPDFYPATTSYTVNDGQEITKAVKGSDNVAVTILQKTTTASDNAYVVTLAEDGESTKTYTVSMPKTHDHTFGEWQVITPATVYAPGLRRRVCTHAGCTVKEEQVIPQIERKSVKWIDVDFGNYTDGSTIADEQVDSVDGGTWAKPSADDSATVAHGDVDLAALVVTNQYLCYAAKAQTSAGRDATVEFTAKFQKPNTDELPQTLDLGQTAVFVFPDGKGSCYKAYTSTGWVKLTGATPDFEKFVTITIDFRYNDGGRSAMVKIDDVICTPVDATSPWFALAGSATKLTSVNFFGEFDVGSFFGEYLTVLSKSGFVLIVK